MFTDFTGHYIPLTWMTLGLDYCLWGMNPAGYHATNLVLHAVNAVLFYWVVVAVLRVGVRVDPAPSGRALAAAGAVGAMLFALHPQRVESVVWITERRDVLAGLFFLLAVLAHLRRARGDADGRGGGAWYVASLVAFLASLLSKSSGVALALVLLVLDVIPLRRFSRAAVVEKLPYLALAVAASWAVVLAHRTQDAARDLLALSPLTALMQPGYRIGFHLAKMVLPVGLMPVYPFVLPASPFQAKYVVGVLVVVAISALALVTRRRAPALLAVWVAFLCLMAPFVGLVQFGLHFAADRNMYLASLPWALLAAAAVYRASLAGRDWAGRGALAVAGCALVVLAALTFRQAGVWHDTLTLWNHTLSVDPDNFVARNNRAVALLAHHDARGALDDLEASLRVSRSSLAYHNRGLAKVQLGDRAGAIADFGQAVQLNPRDFGAYFNRCLARLHGGDARGAAEDCTAGLALQPEPAAFRNRAIARLALGDAAGAQADADTSLHLGPNVPESYGVRAQARLRAGDRAGAAADAAEALRRAPAGWPHRAEFAQMLRQLSSDAAGSR